MLKCKTYKNCFIFSKKNSFVVVPVFQVIPGSGWFRNNFFPSYPTRCHSPTFKIFTDIYQINNLKNIYL